MRLRKQPDSPTPEDVPVKRHYLGKNLYFPLDMREHFKRMIVLEEKTKVSVSRQVAACIRACIDTLEADLPEKRKLRLNGKEVTP